MVSLITHAIDVSRSGWLWGGVHHHLPLLFVQCTASLTALGMPKKVAKKKKKSAKKKKPGFTLDPFHPALLDPEELLVRFLQRVLQWLKDNHARIISLFQKLDSDKDNILSPEDFMIALRMLDAPASRTEIERLISIIDTDSNGTIDIMAFDRIIRDYHRLLISQKYNSSNPDIEKDDLKLSAVSLTLSPSRTSIKCSHCLIGRAEPPEERVKRFLQLKLTLALFKDMSAHPAHSSIEVTDSTTVHGLCLHLQNHLGGTVSTIALFRSSSCTPEVYLPPAHCLAHCGAVGGSKTKPRTVEVFYAYKPTYLSPVLVEDSHIAKEAQSLACAKKSICIT